MVQSPSIEDDVAFEQQSIHYNWTRNATVARNLDRINAR